MPIKHNRLDNIHPDERQFWRWRTLHDYMQEKMTGRDFNTYLQLSVAVGYIDPYPEGENDDAERAVTTVRYWDVVDFLENFVIPVASMLPWGYTTDNPMMFPESQYLLQHIKNELRFLESIRRPFKLQPLIEYLESKAENAFKAVVVREQRYNLGNPIFPPGYERYRNYLCEWAARGCFLAPITVKEHKKFMLRMSREHGVWWKGHPFLRG
jgi:hypothetical protein